MDEKNGSEKSEGSTILVVDDEESIRELFRLNLIRLGYAVVDACDGEEAITLYRQSLELAQPIAAVIFDLSLPGGMSGRELATRLREIHPQVRLIVSSGHSASAEMVSFPEYGYQGALEKDFNRAKMKAVLERVMSAAP